MVARISLDIKFLTMQQLIENVITLFYISGLAKYSKYAKIVFVADPIHLSNIPGFKSQMKTHNALLTIHCRSTAN